MKKGFLIAVVILAVAVAAFMVVGRDQNPETPGVVTDNSQATENSGNQISQEDTVVYLNSGYSPSQLVVEVSSTVSFVNESDLPMWTASNPHPVHTDHPSFDPRHSFKKAETYEFTFTEAGTYEYHNHLSPEHTGTIIVE